MEFCGGTDGSYKTFTTTKAHAVLKPPCMLYNALILEVMKKIIGGKYSKLKEKSTSMSGKIAKMAVSPHWCALRHAAYNSQRSR